MIKVLVADDHAVVRKGLKQIVSETSDIVIADEASNGREVLNKVRKGNFDVIVLDISLPDGSGLHVLKHIKSLRPEVPVLILSIHPEDQYGIRALKAGASGYLTKESAPCELVRAVRKVAQGRKYITSSLAERLAFNLGIDAEKPPHEILSNREYEVMCMIASGKTVTKIAEELSLSVKTISTYRSRILAKMQMQKNAELTYYAIKRGLID